MCWRSGTRSERRARRSAGAVAPTSTARSQRRVPRLDDSTSPETSISSTRMSRRSPWPGWRRADDGWNASGRGARSAGDRPAHAAGRHSRISGWPHAERACTDSGAWMRRPCPETFHAEDSVGSGCVTGQSNRPTRLPLSSGDHRCVTIAGTPRSFTSALSRLWPSTRAKWIRRPASGRPSAEWASTTGGTACALQRSSTASAYRAPVVRWCAQA